MKDACVRLSSVGGHEHYETMRKCRAGVGRGSCRQPSAEEFCNNYL